MFDPLVWLKGSAWVTDKLTVLSVLAKNFLHIHKTKED